MKFGSLSNLNEYNIYGIYHDLSIWVLYDQNGKLATRYEGSKECCLYVFNEDDIPDNFSHKVMDFSQFYYLILKKKYSYFNYYYSEGFAMHVDAYRSFTETALNDFFIRAPKEMIKKYDGFLWKY